MSHYPKTALTIKIKVTDPASYFQIFLNHPPRSAYAANRQAKHKIITPPKTAIVAVIPSGDAYDCHFLNYRFSDK